MSPATEMSGDRYPRSTQCGQTTQRDESVLRFPALRIPANVNRRSVATPRSSRCPVDDASIQCMPRVEAALRTLAPFCTAARRPSTMRSEAGAIRQARNVSAEIQHASSTGNAKARKRSALAERGHRKTAWRRPKHDPWQPLSGGATIRSGVATSTDGFRTQRRADTFSTGVPVRSPGRRGIKPMICDPPVPPCHPPSATGSDTP